MRTSIFSVLLATAAILAGCDAPRPEELSADMDQINLVLDDSDLSAQEKRIALEDLGLSPTIINALLSDQRTANQFGGDLRTAYDKVVADRLDRLTPDEIQIYGDAAESHVSTGSNFTFSDSQAQEIVDLFESNGIQTSADLAAVLDDPALASGLPADLDADILMELFIDFDPDLLLSDLP